MIPDPPPMLPRPRLDRTTLVIGLTLTAVVLALYAWRTMSVVEAIRLQRVAAERMDRDHAEIMEGQREIIKFLRTGR